ncbi:MAG: YihY/virulence factor BrkB family protein [Thermomicrobiales bacterium]
MNRRSWHSFRNNRFVHRDATRPAVKRFGMAWRLLREIVNGFQRHHISQLAKQSAYSLLYAIPSLVLMLVSLASVVDKHTEVGLSDALSRAIEEHAPATLEPLLESLVQNAIAETSQSSAVATALISLVIAIWSISGAVGALIYSCNCVYDIVDRRPYLIRKLLTFGLSIVGGMFVVAGFLLFTFGQRFADWLDQETARSSPFIGILSSSRRWSIALVACSLLLLYSLGPDLPKSIRWVLPGVILATAAIYLVFVAFEYLVRIVNPGSAYGAASSVLVLLWSLYIVSAIVVAGAEINAIIARRHDAKLIAFIEKGSVASDATQSSTH